MGRLMTFPKILYRFPGILAAVCGLFFAATGPVPAGPKNQVFLLYEGYVEPIEGRELVPGVSDDGGRLVASTMGLVQGKSATVFVDPGFITDRLLILKALEGISVGPEDVTHVFISHHHPDHKFPCHSTSSIL